MISGFSPSCGLVVHSAAAEVRLLLVELECQVLDYFD